MLQIVLRTEKGLASHRPRDLDRNTLDSASLLNPIPSLEMLRIESNHLQEDECKVL